MAKNKKRFKNTKRKNNKNGSNMEPPDFPDSVEFPKSSKKSSFNVPERKPKRRPSRDDYLSRSHSPDELLSTEFPERSSSDKSSSEKSSDKSFLEKSSLEKNFGKKSQRRSSKPTPVEERSCDKEFYNQPHSILDDVSSESGELIPDKVLKLVNQYKNETENSSQKSKVSFTVVTINGKDLYFGKKVLQDSIYIEEEIYYIGTNNPEPIPYEEIEIARNYLSS